MSNDDENLTRRYLSFSSFSLPRAVCKLSLPKYIHLFHRAGLRLIAKLVSDFHTPAHYRHSVCFNDPKAQFMTK